MENKQNTQTQIFPGRRTDATYRAVLQRFDPAAGRYRTLESARIETPLGLDPAAVRAAWASSLRGTFGTGASGLRPDIEPIDDNPPLGSGLNLADMDSDI